MYVDFIDYYEKLKKMQPLTGYLLIGYQVHTKRDHSPELT
jgi:hypothetical protein